MNFQINFKFMTTLIKHVKTNLLSISETDKSVLRLLVVGLSFQEIKFYLNIKDQSFDAYLHRILPINLYALYPQVSGITLLKLYDELKTRKAYRFKLLCQSLGYWIFLHAVVLFMFVFYRNLLYPAVAKELEVFSNNQIYSNVSQILSRILLYLQMLFLILFILALSVCSHKKIRMMIGAVINGIWKDNLLVLYLSEQFCLFFSMIYPETKTTRLTLKCLRTSLSKTLSGSIAFEIERLLEQGQDISDALSQASLHSLIKSNMREGFLFNNLESVFGTCLNLTDILILHNLTKVIRTYRMFVSINIIMIVVIYYELVMIPLKLMEGL
ncbi:hypothetical protein [Erysipelothrix sp. P66]|uniref:hypothetical protein n=1 Tax=Erysipelothrix sp. P66 TaxID=3141531 RepID=UPI00315D7472